jgi:hypothetical protein
LLPPAFGGRARTSSRAASFVRSCDLDSMQRVLIGEIHLPIDRQGPSMAAI